MKNLSRIQKYYPWIYQTLKRDNYSCVDCKNTSNVVVHHIDGSRKTGVLNNNLDNLITLCKKCHAKRHGMTVEHSEKIEMRKTGLTFQEIANKFGLSRQRVHQVVGKLIWNRPGKENPHKNKITAEVIVARKMSGLYSRREIKLMEFDLLDNTIT